MNKLKTAITACLLTASAGVFACSDEHAAAAESDADKFKRLSHLVDQSSNGTASVNKVFPGPDGMTGVVINAGEDSAVGWVIGKSIAIGPAINILGENLTVAAEKKHIKRVKSKQSLSAKNSKGDFDLQAFDETPLEGIELLKGDRMMTVFGDPSCGHCHVFYKALQSHTDYLKSHNIGVNWVPVAILGQKSFDKSAQILAGGIGALNDIEMNGSTVVDIDLAAAQADQVNINSKALFDLSAGRPATPSILFTNKAGEKAFMKGAPSSARLKEFLLMIK